MNSIDGFFGPIEKDLTRAGVAAKYEKQFEYQYILIFFNQYQNFLMRSSKKSTKRAVALLTTCKTCWGSRSKMHIFLAVTYLSKALKKIGSFVLGTISLININTCATSVWVFSCWKEETSKNLINRNGSRSLSFHIIKISLSRHVWIHIWI